MLKPHVHQSLSVKTVLPLGKPFLHGNGGNGFLQVQSRSSLNKIRKIRVEFAPNNIKAVGNATKKSLSVKAVVSVTPTVSSLPERISITRGLDYIQDRLGKSLLLELVSAVLDPKTGLEKPTIKGFAHKAKEVKGADTYEAEFQVQFDFGEIGAIFVENEHHKEIHLKDIVLDGLPNGPVNIKCGSWVASKHDIKEKRVFFTNKSYLPTQTPSGLRRLRKEELANLRGNGREERKTSDRIYDYDVYNDIGNPDKSPELKRPVLGGKEHPYPRRCRTGRPRWKTDKSMHNFMNSFFCFIDQSGYGFDNNEFLGHDLRFCSRLISN